MAITATCPNCGSRTRVYSSNLVSKDIEGVFLKDLYTQCLGECRERFVMTLSFSHWLGETGTPPPPPKSRDNSKKQQELI